MSGAHAEGATGLPKWRKPHTILLPHYVPIAEPLAVLRKDREVQEEFLLHFHIHQVLVVQSTSGYNMSGTIKRF